LWVQVQTLSGEGVMSRWDRLKRMAGLYKRHVPGEYVSNRLITSK
jgi:hypothetical protein